jgi:hypothetical protein
MYECIKYLLQDKTDEESLESLCRLLNTIGEELDAKPPEKVKKIFLYLITHSLIDYSIYLLFFVFAYVCFRK